MFSLAGYSVLLNYQYWINPTPVPLGPSLVGKIVFFLGWILVIAIALHVAERVIRKNDKLKSRMVAMFSSVLYNAFFLGLVILFFAYEQIPILGMRLWSLLWLIVLVFWLARTTAKVLREYPQRRDYIARMSELRKYLPGQHK